MPQPNFHAAQIQSPGRFKDGSLASRASKTAGVTLIMAIPKDKKKPEPQSYRFAREQFTADQAEAWLKEKNISVIAFEPAKDAAELSRTSAVELDRSHTFRKDTLRPGRFTGANGETMEVTPERLVQMEKSFAAMRANGVKVPIYGTTHEQAFNDVRGGDPEQIAKNCLGYLDTAVLDGDELDFIYEFADDEAVKLAQRVQQVSACIEPNFTDGEAREYPDAITHVLLTPQPAVSGQGEFKEVACFSRAVDAGGNTDVANLSTLDSSLETEQENEMDLKELAKELGLAEDADEKACYAAITSLKARPEPPQQLARESVDGLAEATGSKIDVLVAQSKITAARADKLKALLIGPDDKRNVYALSRALSGGDQSLASAVIAILSEDDKPVKSGSTTGAQLPEGTAALSRDTDGVTPEAAAKAAKELTDGMAATASKA